MESKKDGIRKLNRVRSHVDRADMVIITALSERMALVRDIGEIKKKFRIPVVSENRDKQVMKRILMTGNAHGLDKGFIEEVYLSVLNEAKRIQNKIVKGR